MKFNCKVVTKEDNEYEESRLCWNRAIESYPSKIIYCENICDVQNAILYVSKKNLPFRIRSGRHHYEGYSTGNDIIVLDVSQMNNIQIDEKNNIVTIEGGVRNREMYEATGSLGYPFPGGGCPTVGVCGLVLGGGWGYSTRLFGLSCDSLIECKLVTYNGEVISCSNKENKELFWALKGAGGGNFGVVVSLSFSLPQKIENVNLINMDFPQMDNEEIIEFILRWQREYKNLDSRANFKLSIYNSKEKGEGIGIKITGLYYSSKEEGKKLISKFKNIPSKGSFSLEYIKVLEANRIIQDSHPDFENYKSTGRFIFHDFNEEEIKKLVNLIKNRAEGAYYTALTLYGLGGNVRKVKPCYSAFPYREANFILGFQSVWEDNKYKNKNEQWFKERFYVIKELTKGSFINFPYKDLDNFHEEYFGENLKDIQNVKLKYDPNNFFKFPQGIY